MLFFTAVTSKNDVTLCKLDVNIKNRQRLLVALAPLNLSRNSLTEKFLLHNKFFENQMCGKSKGMQEKVSIMGV